MAMREWKTNRAHLQHKVQLIETLTLQIWFSRMKNHSKSFVCIYAHSSIYYLSVSIIRNGFLLASAK